MARQNWKTERKWEISKGEQHFIDLLTENGYTIKGFKEWQSKTDYLIEKDGVEQQYSFEHTGNSKAKAQQDYKVFEMFYNTSKQYYELKAKIEEAE